MGVGVGVRVGVGVGVGAAVPLGGVVALGGLLVADGSAVSDGGAASESAAPPPALPPGVPPPAPPTAVLPGHAVVPDDCHCWIRHVRSPTIGLTATPTPRQTTEPMSATRRPYSALAAPRDALRRGPKLPSSRRRARTDRPLPLHLDVGGLPRSPPGARPRGAILRRSVPPRRRDGSCSHDRDGE